jgi:hypothetical protein
MRKKYQTQKQRALLDSIGFPHRPGRTVEESNALILELIENGELPKNSLSPPTERQAARLVELGLAVTEEMTFEKASAIIQDHNLRDPATMKQLAFIFQLGGVPYYDFNCTAAGVYIDFLLENQAQCRVCGLGHDRRTAQCLHCGARLREELPLEPPWNSDESDGPFSERVPDFQIRRIIDSLGWSDNSKLRTQGDGE